MILEEIQNIVDSTDWREDDYIAGTFDCVQMSVLTFDKLVSEGLEPELVIGWRNKTGTGHVWVEVDNLEVECTWKIVRKIKNSLKFRYSLKRFRTKQELYAAAKGPSVLERIRNPWLGMDRLVELKIEWPSSGEHFSVLRKCLDQEDFRITEGARRIIGNIEENIIDIKVPRKDRRRLSLVRIYFNKREAHGMFPLRQGVLNWKDFGLVSFEPERVDLENGHVIFKGDLSSWNFKATRKDLNKFIEAKKSKTKFVR